MAFTKKSINKFRTRVASPPSGIFNQDQKRYVETLLKDVEKNLDAVYQSAKKPLTSDENPVREVINLDGKSGSIRVDLGTSQQSYGIPVLVYASSLGGNVSIAGLDNAYNWTLVHFINRDPSNAMIMEQNAEVSLASTTSLGRNGTMTLMQVETSPVWVQVGAHVSSA